MLSPQRSIIPSADFNRLSWIIAVSVVTLTLWSGSANGAPAKLDSNETPLPLELQAPLFDDPANNNADNTNLAIDSYGNPIEALTPIDTPDGRKVVSAQGLQFEIPNYASGITELKKPADDLLPPFIDPITSSEAAAVQGAQAKPVNPFLSARNNGAYNPQPFSRNSGTPTTLTTTTTTTSTTIAPLLEENPFDSSTVPPWLSAFDYPDVGPGVEFVYDPADPELAVANNLLPPSNFEAQATESAGKPVFVQSSPASFGSFHHNQQQPPKSFAHQPSSTSTSTSSFSTTSSNTFPSKVTQPLPSIPANQNNHNVAVTQPPVVFVPPPTSTNAEDDVGDVNNAAAAPLSANAKKPSTSSSFNTNFAAPFEPTGTAVSAAAALPTNPPIAADRESFPPHGGAVGLPTKTTFTKSDDGKVLTYNVFQQGPTATTTAVGTQAAAKPFGFGNSFNTQQKDYQASQTNQFFSSATGGFSSNGANSVQSSTGFGSTSFNKASTPTSFSSSFASTAHQTTAFGGSGFTKVTATTASGTKYTGGFGGAPGILGNGKVGFAVQNDGSIRDPDHTFRPPTGVAAAAAGPATFAPAPTQRPKPIETGGFASQSAVGVGSGTSNTSKYRGSFGGPPGVLVPFDNVKGRKF